MLCVDGFSYYGNGGVPPAVGGLMLCVVICEGLMVNVPVASLLWVMSIVCDCVPVVGELLPVAPVMS